MAYMGTSPGQAAFANQVSNTTGGIVTQNNVQGALTDIDAAVERKLKNALFNGSFDLWQRNTSFTTPTTNTYLADRWVQTYSETAPTFTISRRSFVLDDTTTAIAQGFPYEMQYYLRWAHTVNGSASVSRVIAQRLESARTFAGKTCTLSFFARMPSGASVTITPNLIQNFGSGGSPTGAVTTAGTGIVVTTGWARYSQTFTIPVLPGGVVFGTSLGTDYLQVGLNLPINQTQTVDICAVQFEEGPIATTYERIFNQQELSRCQRFYWKTFGQSQIPAQNVGVNSGEFHFSITRAGATPGNSSSLRFPVTMRLATPTITTYNPNSANAQVRDISIGVDCTAISTTSVNDCSLRIDYTGHASSTIGDVGAIHVTLESELF